MLSAFRCRKALRRGCREFQETFLTIGPSRTRGTPYDRGSLSATLPGRPLATSRGLAPSPSSCPAGDITHRPQVDLLVRQLEEEGERVLVVLPERYLRPCVPNSARSRRGKVLNKYPFPRKSSIYVCDAFAFRPAVKNIPACAYMRGPRRARGSSSARSGVSRAVRTCAEICCTSQNHDPRVQKGGACMLFCFASINQHLGSKLL